MTSAFPNTASASAAARSLLSPRLSPGQSADSPIMWGTAVYAARLACGAGLCCLARWVQASPQESLTSTSLALWSSASLSPSSSSSVRPLENSGFSTSPIL
eukprot:387251-Prymnesium_polylepis.1